METVVVDGYEVPVITANTVVVGTGAGAVALREVQPEGKRRMTAAEFARGRRLGIGVRCV